MLRGRPRSVWNQPVSLYRQTCSDPHSHAARAGDAREACAHRAAGGGGGGFEPGAPSTLPPRYNGTSRGRTPASPRAPALPSSPARQLLIGPDGPTRALAKLGTMSDPSL